MWGAGRSFLPRRPAPHHGCLPGNARGWRGGAKQTPKILHRDAAGEAVGEAVGEGLAGRKGKNSCTPMNEVALG